MVMHMYAWGVERAVAEVPEVEINYRAIRLVGEELIYGYVAECKAVGCKWEDKDTHFTEVEDAVTIHKQWHEEGMQP